MASVQTQTEQLAELYEQDETAWLEAMSELIVLGRHTELDYLHLSEYLADMARRDRREVRNRLAVLIVHLLKWEHQPTHRSGSWRGSIREQRRELLLLLESKTLANHAQSVLRKVFSDARKQAADETELSLNQFPKECPWTLEQILSDDQLVIS